MTFKKEKNSYVFLTRGEIYIHSYNNLSIHLRPNDNRLKKIANGISESNLKILTFNPTLDKFYHHFDRDKWFLIQTLEYSGRCDHSGFTHISFRYKLDKSYPWEKEGSKILTINEIEDIKKLL